MKAILLLLSLLIFSCTDDIGTNSKTTETESTLGWKSAGFVPDKATRNSRGGGLQKMVHSGNWIVLMDAWTSPVEDKPGYSTWTPRLFISKIGSSVWDTLAVPNNDLIMTIFADTSGFYVGTKVTGKLLKYLPDEKKWIDMNLIQLKEGDGYNIYGISRFQNKLIVSMAGFIYNPEKEVIAYVKIQEDSGWKDLDTPPIKHSSYYDSLTVPLQFNKGVELNGLFYVATSDGVWYLNSNLNSWTKLPDMPRVKWTETHATLPVQDLVAHRNNLYVADMESDLIYEWNEAENKWIQIDSLFYQYKPDSLGYPEGSYLIRKNSTFDVKTLVSDGKHLFISGNPACPMVYMGDYGEPYGNIPLGWRYVDGGWCTKTKCVSTATLYSLDVIGDTLYAAAWEGLFKFPLVDLDSSIADESDFKNVTFK